MVSHAIFAAPLDVFASDNYASRTRSAPCDGKRAGNDERELLPSIKENGVTLVGIGAMTRMAAKAYRMADAIRAAGVTVVMGGPTCHRKCWTKPLARDAGRASRCSALGEADQTWRKSCLMPIAVA